MRGKGTQPFSLVCADRAQGGVLVGFDVHGRFGPVGELEGDGALEIGEGVEVEFAGADGFAARGGEVEGGLEDVEEGGVAVLGGDLGEANRFLGGVHVGGLGLDAFLRVDEAGVGFADLVLDLQAGFVAGDVGGVERGGVGLDLALAGEAVEDIPGSEQADAVVILVVLKRDFVLVTKFLVGDEGVDARQEGGLVDLDAALADFDLVIDHLQFGAAGESEIDEVIDLDIADGRTVEIFVDDERRRVGGELFRPFDAEELAERDFRGDEVVLQLVEARLLVAETDLGAEDIEAGGVACVEEGLLARLFLVEELDGLPAGIDLGLVDDDVVDGVLHFFEDLIDGGAELDQRGLVLELGDGDLLAVDAAGIEALGDGKLDGPEVAEALDGGVGALGEEIVVAFLDAAVDCDLGIEGGFGGDDEAARAFDVALGAEDVGVALEGELEAFVEGVCGRWRPGGGEGWIGAESGDEEEADDGRGEHSRLPHTFCSDCPEGENSFEVVRQAGITGFKDQILRVMLPLPKPGSKPLLERYASDVATKLRHKYRPYYHTAEKQEGAFVMVGGRRMLLMSSNEYLGLSTHPKVRRAAVEAIAEWGTSPCGSRLANGSRAYHDELESALAKFLGQEACHVFSAGYLACMGALSTLVRRGDALLVDKSIHSSLWDGALLSGASIERFNHEDLEALERDLALLPAEQTKAIAVDGVYSMEGHIASLPRIVELADKFGALVIVDDAHGFGVLGREGRGTADHHGVTDRVDVITGSFSKALASTGGFIAGSREIVEYLRSNCRQIIFSAGLPASQAAAALAALEVMQTEPEHRRRLLENSAYYRAGLTALGVDFWNSPTPGLPIVLGDKEKCYRVWSMLWEEGFFTVMAISPGVPAGKDLIRTAVTALHTQEQLDQFLEALQRALKKVGLWS
jgi:8-amino-7-oxononanoate synthase